MCGCPAWLIELLCVRQSFLVGGSDACLATAGQWPVIHGGLSNIVVCFSPSVGAHRRCRSIAIWVTVTPVAPPVWLYPSSTPTPILLFVLYLCRTIVFFVFLVLSFRNVLVSIHPARRTHKTKFGLFFFQLCIYYHGTLSPSVSTTCYTDLISSIAAPMFMLM